MPKVIRLGGSAMWRDVGALSRPAHPGTRWADPTPDLQGHQQFALEMLGITQVSIIIQNNWLKNQNITYHIMKQKPRGII